MWQKWAEYLVNLGDEFDILSDQKGPPNSPLRFWVKTADTVVHDDSFERQTNLKLAGKEQKKATQEQIDAVGKKLQSNHEAIAGAATQKMFRDAAKGFVANSSTRPGSSAFETTDMDSAAQGISATWRLATRAKSPRSRRLPSTRLSLCS